MDMYTLSQLITQTIAVAKKKALGKTFLLTSVTMQKINAISDIIASATINAESATNLDPAFNTLDITIKCYVFELSNHLLKSLAENTDLLCIDAEDTGKLCIQLKILNAATIL